MMSRAAMSRSDGTGRGVEVGTGGLGCSTTTVGEAMGSGRAVGGVSPSRQAIRETITMQAIAPAITVGRRIALRVRRSWGSPAAKGLEYLCGWVHDTLECASECRMSNGGKWAVTFDRDDVDNKLRRY